MRDALPNAERLARLRDPELRAKILKEEVSERLLIVTQELQKLQHQGERTQRWIDASTSVFIAYAEKTTPEAGSAKWQATKERR